MTKISLYFSKSNSCGPLERSSYKPAKKILREARKIFAQSLKKKNTINFGILFFQNNSRGHVKSSFNKLSAKNFARGPYFSSSLSKTLEKKKFDQNAIFVKIRFERHTAVLPILPKNFQEKANFFHSLPGIDKVRKLIQNLFLQIVLKET